MASRPRSTDVRGFTLIEIVVVVAAIMLLVAAAAPSLSLFMAKTSTQDAAAVYVQDLRRAQAQALSGNADSAWGVCVATSTITLYKGSSCAARDTTYDETYSTAAPLTVSGLTDVSFAKFTGLPSVAGTTTLAGTNAKTQTIVINAKGTITF